MEINDGSLDYATVEGEFCERDNILEEIVQTLLDNDYDKIGQVRKIRIEKNGECYVSVDRRVGSKRTHVETYRRVSQPRLGKMNKKQLAAFEGMKSHKMTYTKSFTKSEIDNCNDLAALLRMTRTAGMVKKVTHYYMCGQFDLAPVVEITRLTRAGTTRTPYFIETRPAYIRFEEAGAKI